MLIWLTSNRHPAKLTFNTKPILTHECKFSNNFNQQMTNEAPFSNRRRQSTRPISFYYCSFLSLALNLFLRLVNRMYANVTDMLNLLLYKRKIIHRCMCIINFKYLTRSSRWDIFDLVKIPNVFRRPPTVPFSFHLECDCNFLWNFHNHIDRFFSLVVGSMTFYLIILI